MAPKHLLLYSLLSGFAGIAGTARWRPRHVSNPTVKSPGNKKIIDARGLTTGTEMDTRGLDIGVGVHDSAVEIDFGPRDTITYARKAQRSKPKQQPLFKRVARPIVPARKTAPPRKATPKKAALPKKAAPRKKAPKKATPPKKAAASKKAITKNPSHNIVGSKKFPHSKVASQNRLPNNKPTTPNKPRPGKSHKRTKPAQKTKKPAVHGGVRSRPQGDKVSLGSSSGSNGLIINVKAEDKKKKKDIVAPIMLDVDPATMDEHMKPKPNDRGKTEEKGKGKKH